MVARVECEQFFWTSVNLISNWSKKKLMRKLCECDEFREGNTSVSISQIGKSCVNRFICFSYEIVR